MTIKRHLLLTLILTLVFICSDACTIFSGKDKKRNVWTGNNEDGVFNFNWYLNIIAPSDTTLGCFYFTASNKPSEFIQGGVNDAGLFYDGNSVPPSVYKDYDIKKDFPNGDNAMILYILKKCKTVQQVFDVFKKYRLSGNEGGQLHFADKYGNFGIIVADSMWITKAEYQISTNYNLCHANKDNITCWRYPIAERILKLKGASLNSFREICDSTSQKEGASTIYSNIQNLTTGDIWFYYAMDYNKPYKTNIKELLKKGSRSFYVYELFNDAPIVSVYKTYQEKGIEASLKKLNDYRLPLDKKNKLLRLLSYDLISLKLDFKSYPFLSELINSKQKTDVFLDIINSIVLFCNDKKNESIDGLKECIKVNPDLRFAKLILNQIRGYWEQGANFKFELNGYENAKCVFVQGFEPEIRYFLIRKEGKWVGEFKFPPNEYNYNFLVDGKRVLDPNNNDIVKDEGVDYNRIIVK